ncbi:multidrug resistance-associated protein 1-like isoform X3 [Haliotis rufescens]|uniref:multidrug resistance-associated protein 1-like isoform X3 n=1 Tax=Haliotis rufescens TaxID=6454 RepID=UPI00201E93B5|nr:multidrug resistance-associated protein 1-like isoform X3 [Haliotis rufescens]
MAATSPPGTFALCDDLLWDPAVSVNTTDPDLTQCFQRTVLLWVPCGFLALIAPYRIFSLRNSSKGPISWWGYNIAKLVLASLIGVIALADIFRSVHEMTDGKSVPPVYFISPLVLFLTMVLFCFLVHFERKKGIRTSGFLFNFWLLLLLAAILTYQSNIRHAVSQGVDDMFRFVTYKIYFPLVIAQLILAACVDRTPANADATKKTANPCPEMNVSFLSQITFWWFTGLVIQGYKRALERKDLWALNDVDTSATVFPKFQQHWDKEVAKAKEHNARLIKPVNGLKTRYQDGEVYTEVNPDVKVTDGSNKVLKPRLLHSLVKNFMGFFLMAAGYKLIHDILLFVNPQLLKLLINFTKNKDEMLWRGYLYSVLLVLVALVQSLILHQYFHGCLVLGMRLRTVIIAAVYRKTLKLSNSARKTSTVGEITNLMSVDAQRFMDLTTYFHMIWSAPFQISVSLYFLWQTLGPSIMAGVGVMVLLIPVNAVIANKTKNLQVQQMALKDKRIKLMNEVLNGIKVLKLYAWEPSFQKKILDIRNKELDVLKKSSYLQALSSFTWTTAPFMVSLTTFAVYVMSDSNNVLDAEKAFVSLSLFNILRFPLSMLPQVITNIVQASVSLKRLQHFLQHEELDPSAVQQNPTDKLAVSIDNGVFTWDPEAATTLKGINFSVEEGSLVAVVGVVGAGKSSLLSALLGEMDRISGTVNVKGSVAYVSQQPWIQNATLKDNVLFGETSDDEAYRKVVGACALDPDIEMLPAGDQTEIGEKGINLSGGQKQRVAIARAVYQNTDVYLLDDPLSAVDSHVGKHIFDNVLGPDGMLSGKTRILVTHGISYLPRVDKIVVLVDGKVSEVGSFGELMDHAGAFAEFLKNYLTEELGGDDKGEDLGDMEDVSLREEILSQLGSVLDDTKDLQTQVSKISERIRTESDHTHGSSHTLNSTHDLRQKSDHHLDAISKVKVNETEADGKKQEDKLIQAEGVETGRVKLGVFMAYIKAIGPILSAIILLFYLLYNAASIGSNVWLSDWSNDAERFNHTNTAQRDMRLGVYAALGFSQGVAIFIASVALYLGHIRAGRTLHSAMLDNVFSSPMSFFDTTPLGRVLNRFAKDVDVVDILLAPTTFYLITSIIAVLAVIIIISTTTPLFLCVMIPLMFLYMIVQRFYVASSRQLKRLESVSRSPIYSHFGETITGAVTIRAFGRQSCFIHESQNKVDENQISYYPSIVSNRWLAIRLEFVGNCIIFFASLFAVLGRDSLNPGIVGLSISYAMNVTQTLNWMVRMTCELETNIVAVERIKEYTETPTEAPWEIEDKKPDSNWPVSGKVTFDNYQTRYRDGLDLVLKGIDCSVNSGERVGIVGRTGAGKSSLTLALFRIIESAGGSINIDGIDIAKIGLHDLRSKLTIIPQDPVLFSGSLRMNLDPFDQFKDEDVWRALEHAHLKNYITSLPEQLQYECTEGGDNLSVGQRQLVCLARALLRKTKILILDEATAAVDLETDDLIQATIRTEFAECTVLTIAHRLNTILDYNRIMVLDAGKIREYENPQVLLQDTDSIFYGMAKDAGLVL